MRPHRCSMGFRSGEFSAQGSMSNPVRLLKVCHATWPCLTGISRWVRPATTIKQQTHNLYDVAVRCQMATNVYQRCLRSNIMPHQTMMSGVGRNGLVRKVLQAAAIPIDNGRSSIDRNEIHP
ncbi:hypothetical protein TNCV_1101381 [Trichonephila clavipes]|nr:hypothetical protein TNCV_1101381 [Trichonephila clavipes]